MTEMSLDLVARRVVCASMAYYALDESLLTDAEFDAYCERCADEWKDLTPQRRTALGSAKKIRASGFHVRVSSAAECATVLWLREGGLMGMRRVIRTERQRMSTVIGRWTPASGYRWEDPA